MKFINLSKMTYVFFVLFYSVSFSYADNPEVARVNDSVITREQLDQEYADALAILGVATPSKKDFLKEMVRHAAVIQNGKANKIDQRPIVLKRIDNVIYQSVIDSEVTRALEKIELSDKDIENYYKKNPIIRLSHIFIPVPASADKDFIKNAEKEINRIYKEDIQPKKKSFAEVAQAYPTTPEAANGGDLGYRLKSQLDPAMYHAAMKLSPGKISEPFQSQMGFHIVQLTASRPWNEILMAQGIPLIRAEIIKAKTAEISEATVNRIEKNAKIKFADVNL